MLAGSAGRRRAARSSGSRSPSTPTVRRSRLSVLAVAFALRYRDDPRLRNAVWMGLAAGGAVSIKALSVPAVVIAGLVVLLSHRPHRVRDAAVSVGDRGRRVRGGRAAVRHRRRVAAVVLVPPRGQVGEQPRRGRPQDRSTRSGTATCSSWWRSALALIVCVVRFVLRRRAGRSGDRGADRRGRRVARSGSCSCSRCSCSSRRCGARTSRTWCPRSRCSPALEPPSWMVLAVAGIVDGAVLRDRATARSSGPTATPASRPRSCTTSRRFPSGARFISDDPGFVWRSGHSTPGNFADTSYQRIDDRDITHAARWSTAASTGDVCGVVVPLCRTTSSASAGCPTVSPPRASTRCASASTSRSTSATPPFCASLAARLDAVGGPTQRGRRLPRRSNQRSGGTASMTVENDTSSAPTLSDQQHQHHHEADALTGAEHDGEAEDRADHVGAGVAEHQALAQVVGQEPERRAHHRRDRDADGRGADRERDRHVGDETELDRAPRRTVEQVAEVRRRARSAQRRR